MQSIRSASIMFLRICPSFEVLLLMEPLARTKPAMPCGARWWMKCCTHAKLALPTGGSPVFPADVASELFAFPVRVVKRWIGKYKICFQVFVSVV